MKKRMLSLLLVLAMMFTLAVPAFAGTDPDLKFSLEVPTEDGANADVIKNSNYDITAPAGTVIEIHYYITNPSDEFLSTTSTQDEIQYDHSFFDLVEGSNQIVQVWGDDDSPYAEAFSTVFNVDSEGGGFAHLVKFNSIYPAMFWPNSTNLIGTFKLQIKAGATGSSVVQNLRLKAALSGDGVVTNYNCTGQELTVHVGSASDIAVTSVTVDETAAMYVGNTKTLTATVKPDDATTKTVTWSSDNESVATVDATTGKITAVAEGTANITATSNNSKSDTCAVTVSRKSPTTSPSATPKASVKYGDTVSDSVITGTMVDSGTTITGTFAWKALTSYGDASDTAKTFTATFTPSNDFIGKYKPVDVSVSTTVAKADQNPSVTATKTLYVGGAAFDLNALVSGAVGTVSFEKVSGDAAALSGSNLTPDSVKTGDVVLTVKATGNNNYNAYTGTSAITVTISSKAAANVTITGDADKTYGDQNFTLTASAENKEQTGGTWTWDVGSSGTFEIVSGEGTNSITVKILKANTTGATITASYEDATYIGSDDATIKVAKANPTYTAPTGLTATYGQTLADVTLPAGWSWMASSTSVGNASETPATFNAKFTPADTDNYNVVENIDVNVTVGKASKTATTPVISAHTDTTITANVVTGQKYMIKKSSEAAPTATSTGWSDTAAFTGLDCNTAYKVYTYIPGDDNHQASPVLNAAQTTDKTAITGTVTVSNTSPKYGDTLSAVITSVTPEAARSGLTYQWYRGDAAISGATSSSYKAVAADVGKTLKVKVTASGNYSGELTSAPTSAVAKANAQTIADQTVSVRYDVATQQSKSVAGLMPNDAVALTYTKGTESKTGSVTISSWNVDANGLVTFTLSGGAVDDTVTLPVKINSTNYAESTVNVVITLVDKEVPVLTANAYTSTYTGNPVSVDSITGKSAKVNGVSVDGTWSWKDSAPVNVSDSGTKTLVFTPTNNAYAVAEKEINVTINKATPSGNPTYTTINTSGKTLADANLTKNANWPDGEISWDDDVTTSVEQNKAYRWTFIPSDAANYNEVDGTITLWNYNPGPGPGPSVDYNNVRIGTMDNGKVTATPTAAPKGRTITLTVTPNDGYQLTALTVTDGSNKTVKLTDLGNGKYSFTMPDSDVRVNATFTKKSVVSDCPRDYTCPIEPFTDTVNDAWWHDGIHYCVERGLMQGYPGNLFGPNDHLSRAQIVTILWRMEGCPIVNYAMSFKDVKGGTWYTEAIRWAQSTGVVTGYNKDSFGPMNNITREQLAAILMRYAEYKGVDVSAGASLGSFTDAGSISGWAVDNMKWAVAVGMINGRTATTIAPTYTTTRAEAACMIQRFCENILY